MSTLDPAIRDLLTAVRGMLYIPYLTGPSTPASVIAVRAHLAAVLDDADVAPYATALLTGEYAEAADAGRVRFEDRCALAREVSR